MTIHRLPGRARVPRALVAALAFATFAQAANAALFDDEEARRRIESTNQRLSAVQKQLEDRVTALEQQLKSQGLVDLFNQTEQMRNDIAKLRGQIEVLTYELEQAQKRQRDLYVDLDTRMRKLETAAAAPPPQANVDPAAATGGGSAPVPGGAPPFNASGVPAPSAGVPAAPVAGAPAPRTVDAVAEQRAYDAALDQFKRGDYGGAINAFGAFVKTYPRSPLASSAQYWAGNAQYARRDYRGAIATQRQLLQTYPDSPKAPDALLNVASAQADLNDNAAARRTLEELIARYPQSEAATKARQRLGQR
ncbi:MAG TPA: tol-pal system protein YbgF [Casimicrobiaceae bacterium]|nr:tol-pal system protein YbgF [Casimicrobiaceae bacterium]